jgi:hypothetical protein
MRGDLNIETLYAFIVRDDDGTEGLIGTMTPTGWMPLVGADLQRAASLEPIAQETADASGKCVTLAHFSVRENVKEIAPNRQANTEIVRLNPEGSEIGIRDKPKA